MTTEQPTSRRLLRRRTDDRVIGGVASGLGDFLNVDPLLIRIAFVGLMVFGGLGLLLYVIGWLLVPEESTDESVLEDLIRRSGLTATRWLVFVLFAVGMVIFLGGIGSAVPSSELAVGFGLALMVIIIGGALLTRGGQLPTMEAAARAPSVPQAAADAPPVAAVAPRRRRRSRPRSPLGWYVLGAVLASVGALALATNVGGAEVQLGQFFGLALAIIGIGLVIGTWWGHARALILLGVMLVPLAIAASFITAPIEGGIGLHRFNPANQAELRDEYRVLGGRLELDLTRIPAGPEPIEIAASVTLGQMYVALPADASIELDADVGAGQLGVLGTWQDGTSLVDRYVRDGDGPRFVLRLESGVGSVWVDRIATEER